MSVEVHVIGAVAYFECHGDVSFRELMAANDRVLGSEQAERFKGQFVDFSDVSCYTITPEEAQALAHVDKSATSYFQPNLIAVITRNDQIIDTVRQYRDALSQTDWQVRAFPTRLAGWVWLTDELGL